MTGPGPRGPAAFSTGAPYQLEPHEDDAVAQLQAGIEGGEDGLLGIPDAPDPVTTHAVGPRPEDGDQDDLPALPGGGAL